MALTPLDSKAALAVIDLQKGDALANSVSRMFPRIGESGTTREIIELLAATR